MNPPHLPPAVFALAPELRDLPPPPETASDCANCPMVEREGEVDPELRARFHPILRCCTYQPLLHNFLAGRALRRGGPGAVQVRARIEDRDGVTRWGIYPQKVYLRAAEASGPAGFGRDEARRCPYWVPDGLHCSIWQDRNAVCRSWFCRHDGGLRGRDQWNARRDLWSILEIKLARHIGELGDPPPHEAGTTEAWVAHYIACAERVEALSEDELRGLDDDGLQRARATLRDRWHAMQADALPDTLGASITAYHHRGDHVLLEGYSHYNPSRWPPEVFTLFSVMDGTVGWREALRLTQEAVGREVFTETDIRELFRLGLIEPRTPDDLVPGVRVRGGPDGMDLRGELDLGAFEPPLDPSDG